MRSTFCRCHLTYVFHITSFCQLLIAHYDLYTLYILHIVPYRYTWHLCVCQIWRTLAYTDAKWHTYICQTSGHTQISSDIYISGIWHTQLPSVKVRRNLAYTDDVTWHLCMPRCVWHNIYMTLDNCVCQCTPDHLTPVYARWCLTYIFRMTSFCQLRNTHYKWHVYYTLHLTFTHYILHVHSTWPASANWTLWTI